MLPSRRSSRQKSGYPSQEDWDGRDPRGTTGTARVSGADAGPVCRGQPAGERAPAGRGVRDDAGYHGKAVIRLLRRETPRRRGPRRGRPTQSGSGGGHRAAGHLERGRLSVVGTAQGASAGVGPVGAGTAAADAGHRGGVAADESPPDGSPAPVAQAPAGPAHLWADEARHAPQTPDSDSDGALGSF